MDAKKALQDKVSQVATDYARAMATGTPTAFDTLEAALEFARAWADELNTFVAAPGGRIIDATN